MDEVSQAAAVRAWLERELDKDDVDGGGSVPDGLEELWRLSEIKPGVTGFIWQRQPDYWYRTELDRQGFESLAVLQGSSWTEFSPDGTVVGTARRIRDGDVDALDGKTDIDVRAIVDWAGRFPDPELMGHLILVRPDRDEPMVVMDGNHRATAKALHLLRTDDYRPQPAYIAANHPL